MKKVLVVDDTPNNLRLLIKLLEANGYGCNPPCARQQAILMVINESSLAALTG